MEIVRHPDTNHTYTAPEGQEGIVADLPVVLTEDHAAWSFWKPNPEELAMLMIGHSIVLVVYGDNHPVVAVGVSPEVL